jgi:hypothetical protein
MHERFSFYKEEGTATMVPGAMKPAAVESDAISDG